MYIHWAWIIYDNMILYFILYLWLWNNGKGYMTSPFIGNPELLVSSWCQQWFDLKRSNFSHSDLESCSFLMFSFRFTPFYTCHTWMCIPKIVGVFYSNPAADGLVPVRWIFRQATWIHLDHFGAKAIFAHIFGWPLVPSAAAQCKKGDPNLYPTIIKYLVGICQNLGYNGD